MKPYEERTLELLTLVLSGEAGVAEEWVERADEHEVRVVTAHLLGWAAGCFTATCEAKGRSPVDGWRDVALQFAAER